MLVSSLITQGRVRSKGGVSTIDAQYSAKALNLTISIRSRPIGTLLTISIATVLAACFLAFATTAFAGQASTGKLFFYPCTTCHPVILGPDDKPIKHLPNGFTGHDIKLVGHDVLGKEGEACVVCHDDPTRNPGKLKLIDGTLIDIQSDNLAAVCQKCHSAKYKEWKAGTHGKRQPKCTAAGCHDPHSPQWIYASSQLPFVGTGFQARMVAPRQPFTPLASPPVPPITVTPVWLVSGAGIFGIIAVGLIGWLTAGRVRR